MPSLKQQQQAPYLFLCYSEHNPGGVVSSLGGLCLRGPQPSIEALLGGAWEPAGTFLAVTVTGGSATTFRGKGPRCVCFMFSNTQDSSTKG